MEQFLQQMINGVAWGSILALIALGYTMVYGVLKLINFAHGEVYMVGAFAGYYAAHWFGFAGTPSWTSLLIIIPIAMLASATLGVLIEIIAYRPLRGAERLSVLITAIGMSILLQNLGILIFGAEPKFFPSLIEREKVVSFGTAAITNIQLLIFIVTVVLCVALTWIVHRTRLGKAMRAVSFDRQASALMGININRVIAFTFIVGSALAAAAGILVGLYTPQLAPLMGLKPGIKAFVAAVLGGIGNIPGAMIGGLLMGIAETLVAAYISSTYRDAVAFAILIIILIVRPTGLLGSVEKEKV